MMPFPDGQNEDREYLLSRYLDGDLSDAERADLELQLARDERLRNDLATMRRVDALVREWSAAVPKVHAERFVAGVRRRCEAYSKSRNVVRLYRWFGPLAAAAVIALAVTGYVLVATFTSRQPASAPPVALVRVGPAAEQPRAVAAEARVVSVSFSQGRRVAPADVGLERGALLVATAGGTADSLSLAADEPPVF